LDHNLFQKLKNTQAMKKVLMITLAFLTFQLEASQGTLKKKVEIKALKAVELTYEEFANYDVKLSNCLLYTSPSPRDRTRSRMPSSA